VEDEPLLRQSVAKMLRKAGFSVIEAGDGTAAVDAIRTHQPSLAILFLDITIPGVPSSVVFEEANRLIPGICVIGTSAYSEAVAAVSLNGRIEHFTRKSYRVRDFMDMVRDSLPLRT
jgi:DNA-binding NtrC family response regulator